MMSQNRYDDIIAAASVGYDVPFPLIKAVIATESSFNEKAYRPEKRADGTIWDTSYGLMQLLFTTAVGLGFPNDRSRYMELMDPATNIDYGTRLLAQIIRRFGSDPGDIYAAYNSGAPRRDAQGRYVNTKGDPAVQARVDRFLTLYDGFLREWEATAGGGPDPTAALPPK
jgi:soluble lytic murein transglycosylase-like protein